MPSRCCRRRTFEYTTWNAPTTTGYIDNQAGIQWNPSNPWTPVKTPGALEVVRGNNITFTGDIVTDTGDTGVDFADGTQNSTLSGSTVTDTAANGVNLGETDDQWTCTGQANQKFQFVPGSGGYGQLQVQNSGQDVTVLNSSTSQGQTDIVQEPVNGSAASQWLPQQQSDGSWQFKNQNSGLCLDVYGAGSNTGQQLDQWPCKNAPGTKQDFTAH